MNKIVEKIWNETATEGESWQAQKLFLEVFAKQVVDETIAAILATDHRDYVFTTFDKAMTDGTTYRIVNHVRDHWGFK